MSDIILEVKHLKKYFKTSAGQLHAVDDVNFTIEQGKTLGVVGESGCGKSTLGRTILRLLEPTDGEIWFGGRDITKISSEEMRKLRKEMQIIFQDPYSSLDPRKTVSQIITAPIKLHKIASGRANIDREVQRLMELVGLAPRLVNTYPHELDGGRRQRIGIARALAVKPKFIVCDEPVSALDVSIQAQILNLMEDLQDQLGLTYIFISHDLSVINHFSDDIAVMYLGKVVEKAPAEELFEHHFHIDV
jgi:peptide/nickel transport system ATP-binding protein